MKRIIYLCHYDINDKRNASPAGVTLMRYIITKISSLGCDLTVVSPAQSKNKEGLRREELTLSDDEQIVFLPSLPKPAQWNYLARIVRKIRQDKLLEKELKTLVHDGDTLLVYHSLSLMRIVQKLRRKRQLKLVLQVCEVYADVLEQQRLKKKEVAFIQSADAYVFSSVLLEQQLNSKKKPYAICLGTYKVEPKRECALSPTDKIHCVYAGTLDPQKGGANAAASAAEYLPSNYHMHVLGFGSPKQIENIQALVNDLASRCTCRVTFDGCLSGEEYIRFIQNCDIGLSTQNPNAAFNATSFPSKILTYMANGLKVVSIRIPAIETSAIDEYMCYYNEQTPQEIANAIMRVDVHDRYDGRALIRCLDDQFSDDIASLFEKRK